MVKDIIELCTEKNFDENKALEVLNQFTDEEVIFQNLESLAFELLNLSLSCNLYEKNNEYIDVCGTGGDGLNFLNISTAAAILLSKDDIKVVKHGNGAVSSKCGSSDVLKEFYQNNVPNSHKSLSEQNIAFLFAPDFYPFLGCFANARRKIGKKTIFNFLGPLLNPARPCYQMVGICCSKTEEYCNILKKLGRKSALVVNSFCGADEFLSFDKAKYSFFVEEGEIQTDIFDPETYLDGVFFNPNKDDLQGFDKHYNCDKLKQLLSFQKKDAYFATVMANCHFAKMIL